MTHCSHRSQAGLCQLVSARRGRVCERQKVCQKPCAFALWSHKHSRCGHITSITHNPTQFRVLRSWWSPNAPNEPNACVAGSLRMRVRVGREPAVPLGVSRRLLLFDAFELAGAVAGVGAHWPVRVGRVAVLGRRLARALLTNVSLGRQWLVQMGAGAAQADVSIQLCMSYPRHTLQSVEMPTVTQVRASDDHVPGRNDGVSPVQWNLAYSSLLSWAVGVAPFKDKCVAAAAAAAAAAQRVLAFPSNSPLFAPAATGPRRCSPARPAAPTRPS